MKLTLLLLLPLIASPAVAYSPSQSLDIYCSDLSFGASQCIEHLVQANQDLESKIEKLKQKVDDLDITVASFQGVVDGMTLQNIAPKKRKK